MLSAISANSVLAADQSDPTPKPDTQAKFRQDCLDYELRMADAYDAHTTDLPEVRAAAHKLIVASRKFWLNVAPKEVTRETILADAERIIQQGSNDPLVLLIAGAITPKSAKEEPTLAYLDRATEAMQKSTYGARERADLAMRAYAVRVDIENRSHRRKRKFPERAPVEQAIAEWFASEGNAKDDQRVLLSAWSPFEKQYMGYANDDKFADLVSQTPGVDLWLSSMLQGKVYARQGWSISNADWDPAKLKESNKLLQQAADYFIKAWKHNPKFPDPAAELISIARRGLTEEKPRHWFDLAVTAQIDFQNAYTAYLTVVRPEYQGSIDKLYAFGLECANKGRFDTIVPMQLMEALCAIDSGMNGKDDFWRRAGVFEQVEKMLDGALASPVYEGKTQSDESRSWFNATRIAAAIRAHRYAETAKYWDRTSPESLKRAFSVYQVRTTPAMARAKAAVMAAGFSLDIDDEAAQLADASSAQRLKERFEREVAKLPPGSHQPYLEYWRSALAQYVDYYADKWVDVTFPAQLPSLAGCDDWQVIDPHTIESRSSYPLPLEWLGLLRTPIQLTCDIEAKKFPTDAELGGILLGHDETRWYRACGRLFGIDPLNDAAGHMSVGSSSAARGGEEGLTAVNRIEIQAWPGYSEFFVNGERVTRAHDRPNGNFSNQFDPSGEVALWTPAGKTSQVNVVYSNLKIRRLRLEPPPPSWTAAEAIAFYTNRLQRDDKNAYDYFDRGNGYIAKSDYTAALADFQQALILHQKWNLARVRIGMCYSALGQYEQATGEYQAALARNADCDEALNHLAWLQATCPDDKFRDGKAALKNAERAITGSFAPDGYRVTYAAALVELGRFGDAKKHVKSLSQGRGLNKAERATLELISTAIEKQQPYHEATPPAQSVPKSPR